VTQGPGGPVFSRDGAALIAESASDVCLTCHATEFGAVLGDDPLLPPPERGAGNFVFLLEDNLNDGVDGAELPIPGEAAGHNVVAPGHALEPDTRWGVSPGGTFPAVRLKCTSCHDPHGTGQFRLLLGVGPVDGGAFYFNFPAPKAQGIDIANEVEANDRHTAYRQGMSDWCGNCHGRYHDSQPSLFEHPSDETLGDEILQRYDLYDGDDLPDGGSHATAYLAATPFEDPGAAPDSEAGPTAASRVMCLTCHRAHASSAPAAGRWDFNVDLLQDDGVVSGSWPIPDPYDSVNQGPLCAKCHQSPAGLEAPNLGPRPEIPLINPTPDGR
jgi:cytochrome c553